MSYKETKFDSGPPLDAVDNANEKGKDEEDKEKKKEDDAPPISFIQMFQYADGLDTFLLIFGMIAACGGGILFPVMVIFLGDIFDAMVNISTGSLTNFSDILTDFLWQMCAIGAATWILYYLFVTCLNTAAERQVFRIRRLFLQSVLKQDIGWYDTNTTTDFASKMTQNLNKLLEGMGEKIGMALSVIARFVASLVIAFTYGWLLTLILFALMIPIMVFIGGITAKFMSSYAGKEMKSYGQAGAVAEEVLGGIRTVSAFGGEVREVERYEKLLLKAKRSGIMRGLFTGLAGGLSFAIIFVVWGVSMWFGVMFVMDSFTVCPIPNATYINELAENATGNSENCFLCITECGDYSVADVITVLNSIFMGAMGVAMMTVYTESIMQAKAAAASVFQVINRVPPIDSSSTQGIKPSRLIGDITFRNVFFNYPSRKDVPILQGFDLQVKSGASVALVGPSGCGKSTCVQLVQRFYDPDTGSILLDGQDIKDLNVGWMRDNIGIVSQEPVLFNMSVMENIKFGRENCSQEDIIRSCKEANAYDFIMKLPKKFDTNVGEGGTQLSGGQKQRIAIARALVRNPKVLLLDEATSALDTQSEGVVQEALDRAQAGRTTIIVAHRLTTVRNCDLIVTLNDGKVAEMGTHHSLMEMKGLYHGLVTRQLNLEEDEALDTIDEKGEAIMPTGLKNRRISRQLSRQMSRTSSNIARRNSRKISQGSQHSNDFLYDDTEAEEEEKIPSASILKILRANSPEIMYLIVGLLAAAAYGAFYPFFAELFGRMTEIFVFAYTDPEKAKSESLFYMWMFCALGFGTGSIMFLMSLMFAIAGENLTMRLRKQSFEAMLRQEMGWFDKPRNTTGALCARLSADTSKVQSATGARVGQVLTGVIGLILSVGMALYYNLKLGAVCAAFLPILIASYISMMKLAKVVDSSETKAFEGASKLAIEAISNIRTVAGLRCETKFLNMYIDLLVAPHKLMLKKAHVRGIIFGLANSIGIFSYGVCMWYGGVLIQHEGLDFSSVIKSSQAVNGGAGMIGGSFAFMDEISRAIVAAGRVFHLIERVPTIDSGSASGLKLPDASGNIDVIDVEFSYPTRETVKVLDKLRMAVKSGQKIGLVGHSGCGKSTVIQLIQRFYNVSSGEFQLDQQHIEALNVPWVRSKLGIVSQEPTLFNRTIAENIQYGDNSRVVSMEETIEAAKRANIHSFVAALPTGYETKVGGKGTQLSGGQKQRVAIARALVRNPRILLLDEATSALDSESEGIVQEALEAAQEGRTSITIAHRLSTIQASDVIFVIDLGRVAESGTHQELIKQKGIYYDLWTNTAM